MPKRRRTGTYGMTPGQMAKAARTAYNIGRYVYRSVGTQTPRTRTAYKKRWKRTRTRKVTQKYLKKKIKKFCQFIKHSTATHTRREGRIGRVAAPVRDVNYAMVDCGGNKTSIEGSMSVLRFYDTNTDTLVTRDLTVGGYARDASISIYRKMHVTNNYVTKCHVQIWKCFPKDATDIHPLTAFDQGLVDQGNPPNRSRLIYPSDCEQLKDLWTIKKCRDTVMYPGATLVCTDFQKEFRYEIASNDSHNLKYDRNQGGFAWLVRVCGTQGHDTLIPSQRSTLEAAVDWNCDTTYKIKYNAGKDLNDFSETNNADAAFTNAGTQSAKPVADNIVFSSA